MREVYVRFHLQLDERKDDRVLVTVSLRPEGDDATIQGVAVELVTCTGEPVGARMMLPVSGCLHGPMSLQTELRATEELHAGCRIRGVVWHSNGQVEANCPCDPGTALEQYMRGGQVCMRPYSDEDLPSSLKSAERDRLVGAFPWMGTFGRKRCDKEPQVLEEQPEDLAKDIAQCYGLCEEDAAFIKELLGSDDEEWPCGER